jgi:multidrug transporter EmrE-like cation transporter
MRDLAVILAIFSILLTSIGQILLKIGAKPAKIHPWVPKPLKPYLNKYTMLGYSILFVVTILSIYVLKDIPLNVFFPLFISGNLIAIAIFSHLFLHESFNYRKIMGIFLIISGILIFSF